VCNTIPDAGGEVYALCAGVKIGRGVRTPRSSRKARLPRRFLRGSRLVDEGWDETTVKGREVGWVRGSSWLRRPPTSKKETRRDERFDDEVVALSRGD
jgi:hypothetical protein